MTDSQSLDLVYAVALLVMVGAAVLARGLPIGQMARMLFAWAGIFALVFLLFSFRPELAIIWQRVKTDLGFASSAKVQGGIVVITKSADGHFWIDAEVNGRQTRFMVDSGASLTTIAPTSASNAAVSVDEDGFGVLVSTANGTTTMKRGQIGRLQVGPIAVTDHAVLVGAFDDDVNLLGMNFLSQLKSWRVEGDKLTLEAGS